MTPTRQVRRAMWLAHFDVEPLLSAILRGGAWVCVGLALLSVVLQRGGVGGVGLGDRLQASSLTSLLVADAQGVGSRISWSRLVLDLALGALMLTPYFRVLVSLLYFAWVERNRRYVLLTSVVLAFLTVIVLTDLV